MIELDMQYFYLSNLRITRSCHGQKLTVFKIKFEIDYRNRNKLVTILSKIVYGNSPTLCFVVVTQSPNFSMKLNCYRFEGRTAHMPSTNQNVSNQTRSTLKSFSDVIRGYRKRSMTWNMLMPAPVDIQLLKVNNRNTRTRCAICSKLKIKTPEGGQWRHPGVFTTNFEHFSQLVLVFFLLLTLNMYLPAGWYLRVLPVKHESGMKIF